MPILLVIALAMLGALAPAFAQGKLNEACDNLIVTDSVLLPQAQRLADYRTANTRDEVQKACVVTMGDMAEIFPDVMLPRMRIIKAIRRKLADSRMRFQFLTLFGDASFTTGSPRDHVPTFGYTQNFGKPEQVSFDGAYAFFNACDSCKGMMSDTLVEHYAFADAYPGSEGYPAAWRERRKPFFALGRIPAHSVDQAKAYVDKVIAYEAEGEWGPAQQTWGIVADDDRHGPSPEPISGMPGLQNDVWFSLASKPMVRRVATIEYDLNTDSTLPAATEKLVDLWNSEMHFLLYFGHGAPTQWSNEKIFDLARDSGKFISKSRQPIVIPAACSTAPFAVDSTLSMAEALLFSDRGAIAWIGGAGETFPGPNNRLLMSWFKNIPQGAISLGSLLQKGWESEDTYSNSNLDPWTLLGDPALMVRFPKESLAMANASSRSDMQLPLPAEPMDSIYFELVRIDDITPEVLTRQQPFQTQDWSYERETVVFSERKALPVGETTYRITLADSLNPLKYAVKTMAWNQDVSHYGYFPLQSLPAHTSSLRDARRVRLSARNIRVTPHGLVRAGGEPDAWLGSAKQGWFRALNGRRVPLR